MQPPVPFEATSAGILWVPLLSLAVIAAIVFARAGGSHAGLNRWARTNAYRIVAVERRYLDHGPFSGRIPRGLGVFYVTVEDASGRTLHGYVRCSIGVLALLSDSDEATVRWVE